MKLSLDFIKAMAREPVRNYIAPGLTSSIVGAKHDGGCVRLFHSSRDQQFSITPHSHRFDFTCVVMEGRVRNRIWRRSSNGAGDHFVQTKLVFDEMGKYTMEDGHVGRFVPEDEEHGPGETYGMKALDIHSIYFRSNTYVLFFEGPTTRNNSLILEPFVEGEKVPTFRVEPWMFKKELA